jgi:hypothetical protein
MSLTGIFLNFLLIFCDSFTLVSSSNTLSNLIKDFSSMNDFNTLSIDSSFNLLKELILFYLTDIQSGNTIILPFFVKKNPLVFLI